MPDRSSIEVVTEALQGAKERKFTEGVELSINLKELDLTVPANRIEEEIPLPNGRGRDAKVAVFGTPEMLQKVRTVADLVISPVQFEELAKDKRAAKKLVEQYDFFLAEAPLMPNIGKRLGVVLGPRGKMPRPIPPGSDPTNLVQALKRSIRLRSKGNRTFHAPIGTRTMAPSAIAQNADAVLTRVLGKLEQGRTNIDSVYVKTTMGPAVRLW